ncbi:U32 family peptidase [Paenibacillus tritici]|uniref:U32 family peptidase n=1 Tax=Paenibacillus tritici TaxID=1873425 RepID=UPI001BA7B5FF|nr:U32 family peptidase [Paenibacillus tritici]QUL52232.1 U32 family peptidase [Paenibacillus tritici]
MKIVAPLSNADSYEALVQAGADEFFCGIVPYEWLKRYSNVLPLNRRETLIVSYNIGTYSSMRIIGKMVQHYQVPVKITFNSHYYLKEHYPLILDIIERLMDMGFTTFIIGDPALVLYLREKEVKCDIHISSELEVINNVSMKFFNQFDVSRFIFPRKTTVDNMMSCITNSSMQGMEYEAFIMNAFCLYSGSFCNSVHSDEFVSSCNIPSRIARFNYSQQRFAKVDRFYNLKNRVKNLPPEHPAEHCNEQQMIKDSFGKDGCGVCKVKELRQIGITHLKVVGRGYSVKYLANDIANLKQIIEMSGHSVNDPDFSQTIKESFIAKRCPDVCYYP